MNETTVNPPPSSAVMPLASLAPGISVGDTLQWNGSAWVSTTPPSSSSSSSSSSFTAAAAITAGQAVSIIPGTQKVAPVLGASSSFSGFFSASAETFPMQITIARFAWDPIQSNGLFIYMDDATTNMYMTGFKVASDGTAQVAGVPVNITPVIFNQFYYLINTGSGKFAISHHTVSGASVNETYKINAITLNPVTLIPSVAVSASVSATSTIEANHSICYDPVSDRIVLSYTTATDVYYAVIQQVAAVLAVGAETALWAGENTAAKYMCSNVVTGFNRVVFGGPTKIIAATINAGSLTLTLGAPVAGPITRSYSVTYNNAYGNILLCCDETGVFPFNPKIEVYQLSGTVLTNVSTISFASIPNNTDQIIDFASNSNSNNTVMFQNILPAGTGIRSTLLTTANGITFSFGAQSTLAGLQYVVPGGFPFVLERTATFCTDNSIFQVTCGKNFHYGFMSFRDITSPIANFAGFARATTAVNNAVTIDLRGGISAVQSGLVSGTPYYLDNTTAVLNSSTGQFAGVALSATELQVAAWHVV